jgi:uncharacterized repeat protein (TIGR03803 family)
MSGNKNFGSVRAALLVMIALALVVAPSAWAQNHYETLHRFKPGNGGYDPRGGLIFDAAGNLYGATLYGGVACDGYCGVVFRLTPQTDGTWKEDVLYSFGSQSGDGQGPAGSLIFDANGNLYGTTYYGGTSGAGTIFKLAPNSNGTWTESVLYTFCSLSNCTDGDEPFSPLIFDGSGNLYGTTGWGGGSSHCNDGCGVVFELTPNSGGGWTESTPYSFCPLNKCRDGSNPRAGVIFDQTGNLYGTTFYGGDPACNGEGVGCGVAFELMPSKNGSWTEQVLHLFRGGNGAEPNGLTFGPAGSLYGSTLWGGDLSGCFSGCGVIFELAPNSNGGWKETVLHTFFDHPGAGPVGGSVIFDSKGNLYGVSGGDGNIHTFGSVFEATP